LPGADFQLGGKSGLKPDRRVGKTAFNAEEQAARGRFRPGQSAQEMQEKQERGGAPEYYHQA
jgi:hypothetical protein